MFTHFHKHIFQKAGSTINPGDILEHVKESWKLGEFNTKKNGICCIRIVLHPWKPTNVPWKMMQKEDDSASFGFEMVPFSRSTFVHFRPLRIYPTDLMFISSSAALCGQTLKNICQKWWYWTGCDRQDRWFPIFFYIFGIFTPKLEEDSHFDSNFSIGLKPPTRCFLVMFGVNMKRVACLLLLKNCHSLAKCRFCFTELCFFFFPETFDQAGYGFSHQLVFAPIVWWIELPFGLKII